MATYIWVNSGSGNGLLPDGTKPLPEPMLISLIGEIMWHSPESNFTASAQATILYHEFKNDVFKITANFPGANELIFEMQWCTEVIVA